MLFRVYVANVPAETIAEIGQRLALAGTVYAGIGFGSWGIEPTAVAEIGGVSREDVSRFAQAVFDAAPAEQAVYVVDVDAGVGETWYRDGRVI